VPDNAQASLSTFLSRLAGRDERLAHHGGLANRGVDEPGIGH
jgi:hypothetical protein